MSLVADVAVGANKLDKISVCCSPDINVSLVEYVRDNKNELFEFLRDRDVDIVALSHEIFLQSESLGKGASGARKVVLEGKVYVIKMQELTPDFQNNLLAVLTRNMPVYHSLVSESDDSFAEFPRKEVLGVRIAAAFKIEVPQTQLVAVGEKEVASLQEYLSQEKAVAMVDKICGLSPADIELQSAINVIFFHVITENIDGHYGNVLLANAEQDEEDDDDFNPDFKAIPIDFGLIFPRRDSVYPQNMNLIKKDFFKFFENKRFSVEQNLRPLVQDENVLNVPEIQSIAREHELQLLHENFKAMRSVAHENKGRMAVSDLFDRFITKVVLTRTHSLSLMNR